MTDSLTMVKWALELDNCNQGKSVRNSQLGNTVYYFKSLVDRDAFERSGDVSLFLKQNKTRPALGTFHEQFEAYFPDCTIFHSPSFESYAEAQHGINCKS